MFRQHQWVIAIITLAAMSSGQIVNPIDYTQYVNLFIGTQGTAPGTSYNGGNVFPGAAVPFGVVKVGIDTTEFNTSIDVNAGYTPHGNVTAISFLHESGTGGAPKYGVVPQMPLTSLDGINVLDNTTYSQPRIGNDSASVGYYKTTLENGVTAEMSASRHAGIIKYTGAKYVLVDVSHYLPTNGEPQHGQLYSNGHLDVSANGQNYSGYGVWRGGWNQDTNGRYDSHQDDKETNDAPEGPDWQVYFCGSFDVPPANTQLFSGPYTDPYWPNSTYPKATATFFNTTSITGGTTGYDFADRVGALFHFGPDTSAINSKLGVSWVSVDKACQYASEEIILWELKDTVNAAKQEWGSAVLNQLTTTDLSNTTRLQMLYSSLYKMHLLPSDRTGENPFWVSSEPYYDDYYTLWDTFRCLNSFYLLIEPSRAAGMIRSLIDIWRHERFMPDGRSSNYNGRVQGGSNADNVLADAYIKGLQYSINYEDAYAAMRTDAEVVPPNTFDPEDLTGSTKEGRGALPDWLQYGYLTPNFTRSISRTVEYGLNDFSLSQVAKGLYPADYQKYLNRSAGWQYLWDHTLTSYNFTGFLAPLTANGSRNASFDPTTCGECEWSALSYEALPWEYSWTIPYDMETLISFMGGPQITEVRLDTMFIPGLKTTGTGTGGGNGIGNTLFNPGNEPSFQTPFLYNYLPRRQHKSVLRSRQIINQYYSTSPSGLPGNSDAGAIDSYLIWNFLGLYPVVTQPVYLLLSPWFSDLRLSVGDGNATLHITAEGLSDESYYVQSVTVNGQQWNQSWISHSDIAHGGEIAFVLGSQAVEWDTGAVPPSPGHVTL